LPKDLLSLAHFLEEIKDFKILLYKKTDSTNDVAKEVSLKECFNFTVIISDTQTAGRGRYLRMWFSPPEVNIYMSIIVRKTEQTTFYPSLINLATSVSVLNAIEEIIYINNDSKYLWLKWPNDIYFYEKKLGGILTESNKKFFIIGIGINVNMEASDIPPQLKSFITSICIETKNKINRAELIVKILKNFKEIYELLYTDPYSVIQLWINKSKIIHKKIKAHLTDGRCIEATAIGLNEKGFLRILTDFGKEMLLDSTEIIHIEKS